jgi:hypothetical protein
MGAGTPTRLRRCSLGKKHDLFLSESLSGEKNLTYSEIIYKFVL